MADHIRSCPRCLVGLPCGTLDGLLGQMTDAEITDAAVGIIQERRKEQATRRRHHREYMQKYRREKE